MNNGNPVAQTDLLAYDPGPDPWFQTYTWEGVFTIMFDQGAKEVWICDQDDAITFYVPGSQLDSSVLFPSFPTKIAYDES